MTRRPPREPGERRYLAGWIDAKEMASKRAFSPFSPLFVQDSLTRRARLRARSLKQRQLNGKKPPSEAKTSAASRAANASAPSRGPE